MTNTIPQNVKDALNEMIHTGCGYLEKELAIVKAYYLKRTPRDLFDDVWDLVEVHDDAFSCEPLDRMDWADARDAFFEELKEAITED